MKKPHIILQTWPFNCLTCQHAWESVYEAWHADDGRGGQVVTWRHKGMASMPPWIEPTCPVCAGLRVKTLPPGARRSGAASHENEKEVDSGEASRRTL
jgi:hypothetical protein